VLTPATSLARPAQARGAHLDDSNVISLPASARRGPAQARGDHPVESIAIALAHHARTLAHRAERTVPRAAIPCRHTALSASTLKHFVVDARARANVLAFSCERT